MATNQNTEKHDIEGVDILGDRGAINRAGDSEKLVTVFVPGVNEEDEDDLLITINFVEYRIPKNREVRVPAHVAEFLRCRKQDSALGKKYDKKNQIK